MQKDDTGKRLRARERCVARQRAAGEGVAAGERGLRGRVTPLGPTRPACNGYTPACGLRCRPAVRRARGVRHASGGAQDAQRRGVCACLQVSAPVRSVRDADRRPGQRAVRVVLRARRPDNQVAQELHPGCAHAACAQRRGCAAPAGGAAPAAAGRVVQTLLSTGRALALTTDAQQRREESATGVPPAGGSTWLRSCGAADLRRSSTRAPP